MSNLLARVLLFLQLNLAWLLLLGAAFAFALAPPPAAKPGCEDSCGNIGFPYPFGTTQNCYLDEQFHVTCNRTYNPPKLFLKGNSEIEVITNINISSELRVANTQIGRVCSNETASIYNGPQLGRFFISNTRNKFTAVGCDTYGLIQTLGQSTGCFSRCNGIANVTYANGTSIPNPTGAFAPVTNGSCSGSGCCHATIPDGMRNFTMTVTHNNGTSPCSYGFVAEENSYTFSSLDLIKDFNATQKFPLVIDWTVGNETCSEAKQNPASYACKSNSYCSDYCSNAPGAGYRCFCSDGYEGNPYLPSGCTRGGYSLPWDKIALAISISISVLLLGGSWLYWGLRQRNIIKLREKFFEQNGGILLQGRLSKGQRSVQSAKIFSSEDLKKATNNYHESRVLGRGGQGTVYKGVLPDNTEVAIKKSKITDQSQNQIQQFINEVLILSQIPNHKNVVKLLGCCLETQVPLLVYEFVTNGSLYDHLHNKGHNRPSMTWENRLRIATETAAALSYLHSAASTPIIHRDVKSANILLDGNYVAKVSDFGASKLVPIDQTQLTTLVQGTLGYLDPEYFHTGQLTEKSDVYSFGVLLVELLTGKKALDFDRPAKQQNLASYFVSAMKDDCLFEIVEEQVIKEAKAGQLMEVAVVAKKCLKVKGTERPTMKEVASGLEGMRLMEKHPWADDKTNLEETEYLLCEFPDTLMYEGGTSSDSSTTVMA